MPTLLSPADLSKAQWDNLVALLRAESGLGPAPSGTSPGTRLSGIAYVGQGFQMWTEKVPAIGVQLMEFTETPAASGRHWVDTRFHVIVCAKSTDTSAASRFGANTKPNQEDAMANLQPFVSDGSGNGVSPVLRDIQYRKLGTTTVGGNVQPNAQFIQIERISYEWEIGQGQTGTSAEVFAYAILELRARQWVAIF